MNLYSLPPIIAAIAYFLVAVFVYSRKKPSPVNRSFALMLLCVCLWNVEWAGLILAPDPAFAAMWGDFFRLPLLFIPPTFLHFALLFTSPQAISQRSRKIVFIFYGLSCFFAAINWTDHFQGNVIARPWGYHFESGPLYFLFLLEFISAAVLSFFLHGLRI